ncbi:MAG: putative toxin-antitoxin system toxin component, PIN family [Bdellovibrionales bacterium]
MNRKPRVVIDTNIWVSFFIKPQSRFATAVTKIITTHAFLFSDESFQELETVLLRDKFQRYRDVYAFDAFLSGLQNAADFVPVQTVIDACRDPADNKFLELAVDGGACAILTGDEDLLMLNPFRGIQIVRLQDFS